MAEKHCAWCGRKRGDLLKVKDTNQWAHRGGCMQSMDRYRDSGKPKPAPSFLTFSYDLAYVMETGRFRY